MAGAIPGSSIARNLASTSKSTRDRALRLLQSWLPSQTLISDEDLRKIWKGLFYCVWHADKQPVQIDLIAAISSILVSLQPPLCLRYFDAFLLTIRREWSGIDFLRLDKFYHLIRKFLHCLFVVLRRNCWELGLVGRFLCVFEEKVLLCQERVSAQGVSYHVCEVFLEELKGFLPVGLDVVEVLLNPFFSAMQKSLDKVLVNKIRTSLFDCLVVNGKRLLEVKKLGGGGGGGGGGDGDGDGGGDGGGGEVEVFGTIALKYGFSKKFFDLGSAEGCVQGNRKVLFGLQESFEKLEKDLASSGVEISDPQCREDNNEDEVPELVPISDMEVVGGEASEEAQEGVEVGNGSEAQEGVEVGNGSAGKKKSKKGKKASRVTKKIKKGKRLPSESTAIDAEMETPLGSTVPDAEEKSEDGSTPNGGNIEDGADTITFSESVISNLQMQFEKVAAEGGMDDGDVSSDSPFTPVNGKISKKRKRLKIIDGQEGQDIAVESAMGKSGEKSSKKVRFSMKSNLVWKPHSPLPPQSLRLPPSATPRGSALKKGIPPGPVRESPVSKKVKRSSSGKKARKGLKSISPAVKRLRKLRSLSV